ncbi:redoxin domain-containing protein [Cytophagales bacterium LB-30]|uniref:Redoxin domain-containing protein n=1 Tax=Shiella aurantiaca TaxID=3058365 RepID=A0ABT8F2A0_9BACT|nr:redoxin domain-containing protein [Shiella aurantiaca]MDN4164418.1 redoxin domain-containing protein [Shiella aurantiaca]
MALKVGDAAPSFKLFDTNKKEVSLEDYKGKNLVVLFFPLAFTSVCTTELCTMRDSLTDFNALNAEVVGISVDSLFTLEKFKQQENINFPLLSDFNKETSGAYGALYQDFVLGMKGVSKRSAFVIDPAGKIKYAEVLESAGDLPNFEAIKASLN